MTGTTIQSSTYVNKQIKDINQYRFKEIQSNQFDAQAKTEIQIQPVKKEIVQENFQGLNSNINQQILLGILNKKNMMNQ